jgi:putative selenium metabolism hydrolase
MTYKRPSQPECDDLLALCRSLLRTRSYSGEEGDAARELLSYFYGNGTGTVTVDRFGNVICTIEGSRPGPRLLFDGHMDTVPVTDDTQWTYPPFAAEVRNGRLYGRGATDMKCALAAMSCAAVSFAKRTGGNFPGSLHIAGTVHEECFEGVAARSVSSIVQPDYVVIGEATGLNLNIGQRGRAEIKLSVFGKPAHSANPEKGVNAVYGMAEIIARLRALPPPRHEVLGPGILELTDIRSAPYPGASVVPEYCEATYDRRLLTGETKESVLAPIQVLLEDLRHHNPQLDAQVSYAQGEERCYTGETISGERFFPGWLFDSGEDFVRRAKRGLDEAGIRPVLSQYNFCTNGSHYAGEEGIRTLGFGPSVESLAHTVNEYVELDEVYAAMEGYAAIMRALLE